MPQAPDPGYYHYDQKLGDPLATFTPAVEARPDLARPEIPATFVATVEGETLMNTMWGKRSVRWRAEPGTRCVILGYWSDNTIRLQWRAIAGAYRIDGRFPAWVVADDPNARMAGGGHILEANQPQTSGPPVFERAVSSIARVFFKSR